MTFLERYKNGETIEVYQEIQDLGQKAFEKPYFKDVNGVLNETFERVNYNLEIIYQYLVGIGYKFRTDAKYTSYQPIAKPLENCEKLLEKLDKMVKPFGHVPLSFKTFYRIVGSCNFTWDYETDEYLLWGYSDAIEIFALDDLIDVHIDMDWRDETKEMIEEEGKDSRICLDFAADFYHKDNVSGGGAYTIEITKKPSIDSSVHLDNIETTFINYLRMTFENCGFLRITYPEHENDYAAFFEKVKPQLKKI
jgi:hypothetical protein